MSKGTSASEPRFAAFVAIDWADEKHVWSMQAADCDERQRGEVNHNPEAIESWVAMLSSRFPANPWPSQWNNRAGVGVHARQV